MKKLFVVLLFSSLVATGSRFDWYSEAVVEEVKSKSAYPNDPSEVFVDAIIMHPQKAYSDFLEAPGDGIGLMCGTPGHLAEKMCEITKKGLILVDKSRNPNDQQELPHSEDNRNIVRTVDPKLGPLTKQNASQILDKFIEVVKEERFGKK